jgi:hypothetical protein
MARAFCVYDKNDTPTIFLACEIDRLCEFVGTTISNLKERMASKRQSVHIGDGFTVMRENHYGKFMTEIGKVDNKHLI